LFGPEAESFGLLATDGTGSVAAVAVADWYERCGVLLASYLAVRPGLRDRGVGRTLAATAVDRWVPRLRPRVVVAEVEDPRHWSPGTYGDSDARLRLYWSLGGRLLDIPYFQPEVVPGEGRVFGLMLMAFPTSAGAAPPTAVDAASVACFIDAYLQRMEGPHVTGPEADALRAALRESDLVATVEGLPPGRGSIAR
jgi:hypothetical protein